MHRHLRCGGTHISVEAPEQVQVPSAETSKNAGVENPEFVSVFPVTFDLDCLSPCFLTRDKYSKGRFAL